MPAAAPGLVQCCAPDATQVPMRVPDAVQLRVAQAMDDSMSNFAGIPLQTPADELPPAQRFAMLGNTVVRQLLPDDGAATPIGTAAGSGDGGVPPTTALDRTNGNGRVLGRIFRFSKFSSCIR